MLYREQYDRMKRRHARFAERSVERSMQSLMDDAQAFFESCLHLRDWIKNDEQLPQSVRDAVDAYVRENKTLRQCRDIAVASKHLKVEYPLPERPRLRTERTTEQLPALLVFDEDENFLPPGTMVHANFPRVVMETNDGNTIDAVVFAGDCLQSWDHFFAVEPQQQDSGRPSRSSFRSRANRDSSHATSAPRWTRCRRYFPRGMAGRTR